MHPITTETLLTWHEQQHGLLIRARAQAEKRYRQVSAAFPPEHLGLLAEAIERAHVMCSDEKTDDQQPVTLASTLWCQARGLPVLTVLPARQTDLEQQVRLDAGSLEPEGVWDVYCPDLTSHDDWIGNLLLLCRQVERTSTSLTLFQVPCEQVPAVVGQLRAFYARA